METLIKKLNCISDAWKAQFEPPYDTYWTPAQFKTVPDLPLVWSVHEGILYLDHVWICPVAAIRQDTLDEAPAWVNPVVMEIELIDGTLDIILTKWINEYAIAGVERSVVSVCNKRDLQNY